MTPIIITLSLLISSKQGRINSGTDLGTGYGGTVCGFHTRPSRGPIPLAYVIILIFWQCLCNNPTFLTSYQSKGCGISR